MRTFVISAALVVALDQATKHLIKTAMKMYESIIVIKDVFKITYIENSGIAFGIFNSETHPWVRWVLAGIILVAAVSITVYWAYNTAQGVLFSLACGMILGGALGNLIDRVFIGRITDFIEVGYRNLTWPVFNIADSAVSVGVCLFIIFILTEKKEEINAPGTR
jgi:signal peptidase II